MPEKHTATKQTPAHVVRIRDVLAEVHARRSLSGYQFYEILLRRTWQSSTGRQSKGGGFFAENAPAIAEASMAAAAWINSKQQGNGANENHNDAGTEGHVFESEGDLDKSARPSGSPKSGLTTGQPGTRPSNATSN